MDLRRYMFEYNVTAADLAKHLECSRQLIWRAKTGKSVSRRFAKDLEKFTDGKVTIEEIIMRQ